MTDRMKRTLIAALGVSALILTGCSSDTQDPTEPAVSNPGSTTSEAAETTGPAMNKRDAIAVTLGDPVILPGVIDITDTSLTSDGCIPHERPEEIAKRTFAATVKNYAVQKKQWLWPTDIDYVDADGKITRNSTTNDLMPCNGGQSAIDLPPNSSMDARVTLDIPRDAVAIGYNITSDAGDQRVEWDIPDGLIASTEQP